MPRTTGTSQPAKLHLGCGTLTPEGWLNVDGSWSARFAKHPRLRAFLVAARIMPRGPDVKWSPEIFIHDLSRPLPFPEGTFEAVYSSHTLEHLYLEEADRLLQECFRVLAPGGVARMVVPDLRAYVEDYLGQRDVPWLESSYAPRTAADRLNRNLMLRSPTRERGSFLRRIYQRLTDLHSHKWMYDADSLAHHMREAGFQEIGERQYLDSRIAGLGEVERPERLKDGKGIAVEGVKSR